MTIRERLLLWITGKLVQKFFIGYVCPFGTSSSWLATQSTERKLSYALQAKELLENEVFDREMQEMTRKYYHHLAMDTKNVEETAAYRLTLTFIKEFQQHIIRVASNTQSVKKGEITGKL
jgi:hypothetical protein